MENYKRSKYYGYICQGNLREAVAYLKKFPYKRHLVKKYEAVFVKGKLPVRSESSVINEIDALFQEYYRQVFWFQKDKEDQFRQLCTKFAERYEIPLPKPSSLKNLHTFWDERIEKELQQRVEKEGFHYLGGETQGFLGPYIWKKTVPVTYRVSLPDGVTEYTVNMMKGFVSRSWMAFLSFDRIGAGGWAQSDGVLNCVWKSYARKINRPSFRIDFLKHEAQHVADMKADPHISFMELEYRAKLVQLIYAVNMKSFFGFLSEADDSDKENSHTYASYLIVRNLSRLIFNEETVRDDKRWRGRLSEIKKYAQELFMQYPKGI